MTFTARNRRLGLDAPFREDQHPRNKGKFAKKGSGSGPLTEVREREKRINNQKATALADYEKNYKPSIAQRLSENLKKTSGMLDSVLSNITINTEGLSNAASKLSTVLDQIGTGYKHGLKVLGKKAIGMRKIDIVRAGLRDLKQSDGGKDSMSTVRGRGKLKGR